MSYALTDLTYRAVLPIEDLLAGSGQFTALSAASILTNQALTILDYRKLIVDIEGIRNAWIEPIELPYFADLRTGEILLNSPGGQHIRPIGLRGVYKVRVEYTDESLSDGQKLQLRNEVLARLHQHRNLCEDFADISGVERQLFRLCGEVELTPDADVSAVHLDILRAVQNYLAPGVRRYSRDAMLAKRKADGTPYTPADLFDGPLLEQGFIDSDELEAADLRTEVRLSDVISLVMDIPGVRAVRELLIAPEPVDGVAKPIEQKWLVAVEPGKQPSLNTGKSRLVYYKRNIPMVPAAVAILPAAPSSTLTCEDVAIPAGRERDVSGYTSFQQHFPAIYGVGDQPLPPSASVRRHALAKQLKAYLLFFDQVMANYCAQLAHAPALFSIAKGDGATYFTQIVSQSPDYLAIYGTNPAGASTLATALANGVESPGERRARRTRFLDHLIARFAEQFHEYAQIMESAFGATPGSLLDDRRAFLADYPVYRARPGTGVQLHPGRLRRSVGHRHQRLRAREASLTAARHSATHVAAISRR